MSTPAVSIVLPTYNEAANMPVLIPRIVEALREAGLEPEVIVVDDNSPDATADAAEALAPEHPVRVIRRIDERGLATAVLAGFAQRVAKPAVGLGVVRLQIDRLAKLHRGCPRLTAHAQSLAECIAVLCRLRRQLDRQPMLPDCVLQVNSSKGPAT